jgi:hypothetical protein
MIELRQIFVRVRDDARGASLYARSHWEAFSLTRKKKRDGKALLAAYREIGDRASETEEAKKRRSFGSVKENEAKLAESETALASRREAEELARRTLAERTAVRKGELDEFGAEASRWSGLHGDARRARRDLEKEISRLEARIAKPEEGDSPDDLGRELGELKAALPDLEATERSDGEKSEEADAVLSREKKAWKAEEDDLEDKVRAAVKEVRRAEALCAEAEAAVEGSHEALGKSVVLAGLTDAGMKEPMDRAKALLASMKESTDGIRDRRVTAATVRTEATRFVMIWGGTLLLLIVVLGLAFSGDNGAPESSPDRPATTPKPAGAPASAPTPGVGTPTSPDRPPEPAADEETAVPLERFRDALLAHPTFKTDRPDGKIEILSRAPATDGAERIDLKVDARRGEESVKVIVRVVVDGDGKLLSVDRRATETSEDDELRRLLEEIE